MGYQLSINAVGDLEFSNESYSRRLHPIWLRERSLEPEATNASNHQRLYDPADLPSDLTAKTVTDNDSGCTIHWSDGHVQFVNSTLIARELGWEADPTAVPTAIPWSIAPDPLPRFALPDKADSDGLRSILKSFWTHGFVILEGTPTIAGSLEQLAARFGEIRSTNFGFLFDVMNKPDPSDLAYTPMELKQHTDNPYRTPVPGIQFLHCLENDAEGGESTLADGYATFLELAHQNPEGHKALTTIPVVYRYKFKNEALESKAPILETDFEGNFTGIRNSDRVDFVSPVEPERLDIFYKARRQLRELINNPSRLARFKLNRGDLLMMDNRRILHGRQKYTLTSGSRHLQGCYIDHDGPDMRWRKLAMSSGVRHANSQLKIVQDRKMESVD